MSNYPTTSAKPSKPYPHFPLFPHATKRWAKKIRGKLHYFGPWSDPDAALARYEKAKDDLHAGRKPRQVSEGVTIKELANAYLNHKKALLDAGELSPRTWQNYREATDVIVARLGKSRLVTDLGQDDFAALRNWMAKRWGPVRLYDFIQRIRSVCKYAFDAELIAAPIRFGPGFKRPSKKTLRLQKAKTGPKMFEADELRRIIDAARQPLKAMILLGVNAGFGNADCGTLPLSALDLENGWVNYHRVKTGTTRRCHLWPETVDALKEAIAERPTPKDAANAGLAFITVKKESWHKPEDRNPISAEMRKLLDAIKIGGKRNFYCLRHVFETIGGESKDQVAVDAVMGHTRDDMATNYRERISDERLKAVSEHVRGWLFQTS